MSQLVEHCPLHGSDLNANIVLTIVSFSLFRL